MSVALLVVQDINPLHLARFNLLARFARKLIFTCGEVRARRSRDDNGTSCLIYVKEAIRGIFQSNFAPALRLCGIVVKALDSGS